MEKKRYAHLNLAGKIALHGDEWANTSKHPLLLPTSHLPSERRIDRELLALKPNINWRGRDLGTGFYSRTMSSDRQISCYRDRNL
ncbi:MAG: hypothetical protein SVX43_07325 [Cyanobacteriota bacterium]|nr:hypothetical protein [Cyanobacteriota bacterium]